MAARGDVGVTIDVTKMPVRETGMTPYEILLSESQERMLVVAKRGRERQVEAILAKWDLAAAVIGEVIAEPVYRVTEGSRVVAEFPGSELVSSCPFYTPNAREDDTIRELRERDLSGLPDKDPAETLLAAALAAPTIASKRWVTRQYDTSVQTNTVLGPGGGDAAVVRIRDTDRALAIKTDGNGRYTYLDPRTGGRIAVAEAARNVACVGGRPMAITNSASTSAIRARPEVYLPAPRGPSPVWAKGVPGARHAGHRRQRVALQREPQRSHLPDASRGHGRHRRPRHECDAELVQLASMTPSSCSGSRPRSWVAASISRRSTGWWPVHRPRVTWRRSAS